MRVGAGQMKFFNVPIAEADATAEVLGGLKRRNKSVPPKYFYDQRGSELFTEITRLPEYYLTRAEVGILRTYSGQIADRIGRDKVLVEYGSGSSEKIRVLLDAIRPRVYAPLDISRDYLQLAAEQVSADHPWLDVYAACVDYTDDFTLPFDAPGEVVGFFPGSSIGNFSRPEALGFLTRVRKQVDALLIGVDLIKGHEVLHAAYNDSQGLTGDFNLNLLSHLNSLFAADFELEQFRHEAEFNEQEGRVEMYLVSQQNQTVTIEGEAIRFEAGERLHTENSHKYHADDFLRMAASAGFSRHHMWTDEQEYFGLFYLQR
jgi:dimethylhistidine N-methyltransferase